MSAPSLVDVLAEHRGDEVARDCIPADDGRMAWVYARRCDCGWHGPSDQHDAHLAAVVREWATSNPTVAAVSERLQAPEHAPMSDHDPETGECRSCPWPAREVMTDRELAHAALDALPWGADQ